MAAINEGARSRYVILDLSACFATDNTINGNNGTYYSPIGPNHMNVIKDNHYIVGVIPPDSLTTIEFNAFSGIGGLTSVTIPAGVTSIGQSAFSGISGLTSITIPTSVTSISAEAFSGCRGLTSVTFDGIINSGNFSDYFSFPGNLRAKYLAGGPGRYTRTLPATNPGTTGTWTKQ